jgi:hypothetical protein
VPVKELTNDRKLRIKVKGDASGSRDWYMTMQYPLIPKIKITPQKIVNKDSNGKLFQQVKVSIDHFDIAQPVKILTDGHENYSSDLTLGINDFYIQCEEPKTPLQKTIEIILNGDTTKHQITIHPVKKITFYLIFIKIFNIRKDPPITLKNPFLNGIRKHFGRSKVILKNFRISAIGFLMP